MAVEYGDGNGTVPGVKRKRGDTQPSSSSSSSSSSSTPAQLAANLKSTSPDLLRQTLTEIRQSTRIDAEEQITSIGPNDKRLAFVRELLQDRGWMRLLQAWETIHDMAIPSLQALPIQTVSNIIALLSCHFIDHEVCSDIIQHILPSAHAQDASSLWNKLHSYLVNSRQHNDRNAPKRPGDNEALLVPSFQLLSHIVRFQRGRFSRIILDHFPWSAKSLSRLVGSKQAKAGRKNKQSSSASGNQASSSSKFTFARPNSRLAFTAFILAILYPTSIPTAPSSQDDAGQGSDTGAPTSLKIQLLSSECALPHLTSILKTLPIDPTSVVLQVLAVLQRSLLRDAKLPRTILVNLTRTSDLLSLLLQLATRGSQLQDAASALLTSLCTVPGRGVCFQDQGWYGRSSSSSSTQAIEHGAQDDTGNDDPSQSHVHHSNIYNPILNAFIHSQSFSPLYSSSHRDLLLDILNAAKELQLPFLNSARGPFGGGRMEPPLAGTAPGAGARLGTLLANRLMGQVLSLDLPAFHPDRPPPMAKLVTGLVPNTIPRVNFIKGLKHTDRLVQWSTLELLTRILARVQRFQVQVTPYAHSEESWATALTSVTKECAKRLPDVSTVLQVIEGLATGPTAEGNSPSTSKTDFLLLEAALRASHLLLQVSNGSSGGLSGAFDARKLLNVAGLIGQNTSQASRSSAESEALRPIIQLHVLRILRFARLSAFFVSSSSDSSIFSQLVLISRSPEVAQQVQQEATNLLLEAFGVTMSSMPYSTDAAQNQLLFEGDTQEPEAWVAALPHSLDHIAHVVLFLEDCLSRCAKTSYRYLESARKLSEGLQVPTAIDQDCLSVSPLLATLYEQLLIKVKKDIFTSTEALAAVLQYLGRLLPLLAARRRPHAGAVLHRVIQDVSQAVGEKGSQIAHTLQAVLSLLSGDHKTTSNQVPAASQLAIRALNAKQSLDSLLLDPYSDNVVLALQSSKTPASLPPHLLLLHAAALESEAFALIPNKVNFSMESSAFTKMTLHLVELFLQDEKQAHLASAVLQHLINSQQVDKNDFRQYFLVPADSASGFNVVLVRCATKLFDSLDDEDRTAMQELVTQSLEAMQEAVPLGEETAEVALLLLPYFSQHALEELQRILTQQLAHLNAPGYLQHLRVLRNIVQLSDLTLNPELSSDLLLVLMRLPKLSLDDSQVSSTVVAIAKELLTATNDSSWLDAADVDLSWLSASIPGADDLQADLIDRFPSARREFAARVLGSEQSLSEAVRSLPRSIHACIRSQGGEFGPLIRPLAGALFSADDQISVLSGESLDAVIRQIANSEAIDLSGEQVIELMIEAVPQQPGKAFTLGAFLLGARLAVACPESLRSSAGRFLQTLLDRGLAWLVRRFAEDDFDQEELIDIIDVFANLIHHASISGLAKPKAHLASPVMEAGFKRRFTERHQMDFLQTLTRHTDVGEAQSSALFTAILAHSNFKAVVGTAGDVEAIGRPIVVSSLHSFASRYTSRLLTGQNCRALIDVYGGTLSLADRLIFDLFKRSESVTQGTFTSLAKFWSGTGSLATSAPTSLDALLSLDPAKAFATCSAFPRERRYGAMGAGLTVPDVSGSSGDQRRRREEAQSRERELYDPLWVLLLTCAALNEEEITGLQWLAIVRSNAIGVAVCGLSSKCESARGISFAVLSRVYDGLVKSDLQEKDHLLMALDAIKNNVKTSDAPHTPDDALPLPLPLTTTLFIAHHLRLITSPSSSLYPTFSRFLLQRPRFDATDVPMLYSMLQSSDPDHWKLERTWMLRFIRDCLRSGGSTFEWKVMKRRYVWELLCSLHHGLYQAVEARGGASDAAATEANDSTTSASASTSLQASIALIQDIFLIALSRPHIATELITRKGLLSWISQRVYVSASAGASDDETKETRRDSNNNSYWLHLLHTAWTSMVSTGVLTKMDSSTSSMWCMQVLHVLQDILQSSGDARESEGRVRVAEYTLEILHLVSSHLGSMATRTLAAHHTIMQLLKGVVHTLKDVRRVQEAADLQEESSRCTSADAAEAETEDGQGGLVSRRSKTPSRDLLARVSGLAALGRRVAQDAEKLSAADTGAEGVGGIVKALEELES